MALEISAAVTEMLLTSVALPVCVFSLFTCW